MTPLYPLSLIIRGKDRLGIKGKKSGLVFDFLGLLHRISCLANHAVHVLLENVMVISNADAEEVAMAANIHLPVCFDAKEASWAARERLF